MPARRVPGKNRHWCSEAKSTCRRRGRSPRCRCRGGRRSRRSRRARARARPARSGRRPRCCREGRSPSPRSGSAWWPGGRTSANPPRSTASRQTPAASRAASQLVSDRERAGLEPHRPVDRGQPREVLRGVHALQLLLCGRPVDVLAGSAPPAARLAPGALPSGAARPGGGSSGARRCLQRLASRSDRRPSPHSEARSAPRPQVGRVVGHLRERRARVHRRDAAVEPERVGLARRTARPRAPPRGWRSGRSRSAAVFAPTPARAGDPVGRVAAQRDEVGHLLGLDAVALAHLRRPDPQRTRRTPRCGCRIVVCSLASWNVSRSPLATSVLPPRASS